MAKTRKPNFSDEEMMVLVEEVEKNYAVLTAKFSPVVTNERKTSIWKLITEKVNTVSLKCIRNVDEVKKKWQDAQSLVKKKEAERKKAANGTGGGPAMEAFMKPWERVILRFLSPIAISGLPEGVDTSIEISDVPPVVPVYNQEGSTSDGEGSSTEDSNEVHLNATERVCNSNTCIETPSQNLPSTSAYSSSPYAIVILNDIESVTEALVKRKADFANRPHIQSMFDTTEGGKDIALANYTPTWKLHRKLALKALKQYLAGDSLEVVLHGSMEKCLPLMAKQTGAFNPEAIIDLMVYNILSAVCFGKSVELDDPDFTRFMSLNKEITELFGIGLIEDLFPIMKKIWTTQKYRKIMKMTGQFYGIIKDKIEEHKKTFNCENIKDFTDAMLLAKYEAEQDEKEDLSSQLTDAHVRQTIADIFNAGIDTSRFTLYYAVRYMAGYPEIQAKVQEEIDRVVGKDRLPGLKDRDALSYTEATLHETMRLGLAAPFGLPHSTLCDTQVRGYDVPKRTTVMINHWALHHDPKHWTDVEKFDPTRFLDQNGKLGPKPESWLPFSAGRRVCLGETVAKPELHLIFASIMQAYRITLPEGASSEIKLAGAGGAVYPAPYEIIAEKRI